MLTRKKPTNRKIEINPYANNLEAHHGNKSVVDSFLAILSIGKKKEEPRVNPFLAKQTDIPEYPERAPEQDSTQKKHNFLWYIPIAISDQIEWIKSRTSEGKRNIIRRSEDKARYEHFIELCRKKD